MKSTGAMLLVAYYVSDMIHGAFKGTERFFIIEGTVMKLRTPIGN